MRTELAKRLVSDPEFIPLFDELRADILRSFELCKPDDTGAMQVLRIKLDCLGSVRAKLEGLAYDFDASVRATKTTL